MAPSRLLTDPVHPSTLEMCKFTDSLLYRPPLFRSAERKLVLEWLDGWPVNSVVDNSVADATAVHL